MRKTVAVTCLFLLLIFSGIVGGVCVHRYIQSKTVVFRLSTPKSRIDYDLLSAIQFLEYQFQQAGYRVLPWRDGGNFYYNQDNDAGINVFIRGFSVFYDTRMNDKALDIYYLHRFTYIYMEEFRGYDYYLSSQKKAMNMLKDHFNIGYFGAGAVPHPILEADYKYDILYVYETRNMATENFLRSRYQVESFAGIHFANLSKTERENALRNARLVFYEFDSNIRDDADYVPYGVLDIISYGRPVMMTYNPHLAEMGADYLFSGYENMQFVVEKALTENDAVREEKAKKLRENLLKNQKLLLLDFKVKRK